RQPGTDSLPLRGQGMCGISGFVNRDKDRPADEALLRGMPGVTPHRGPDGSGHFVSGPLALGHRRLSIIDLSENGAQPMHNEDGTVTVTFNGEIYNYLGLRDELIAKGHVFRSRCDTEVLVHGYEEWGDALPERLAGMFAFRIWDAARPARRDVRLRHRGRAPAAALPRPRSAGQEAGLLPPGTRAVRVRVGDQ